MKSVKPGRGPSMMGGIGSIGVAIGGVIWMIATASIGGPTFLVWFGLLFIALAVIQAVYHLKNATGENRMSLFDITEHEPDPMDNRVRAWRSSVHEPHEQATSEHDSLANLTINFCPNCGANVQDEAINFCPSCGQAVR